MNRQEIEKALIGKVITFASVRPFVIEEVNFHGAFIMMVGNGYAVPLDNEYVPTLIRYGAVEVSHRTYTDEIKLVNVTIQ